MAIIIFELTKSQSTTESAFSLPFCRSPTLTVGVLKQGASVIPLEEFPTTKSTCFSADKYLKDPRDLNAIEFFELFSTNSLIKLIMILP